MGRPKKVRSSKDDAKPHRIWEFTDWKAFDDQGEWLPERKAKWMRNAEPDMCRKLMLAREKAPTTGAYHAQGRMTFVTPHSFAYVTKLFGCHVEITVATDDWSYFNKLDESVMIDVDFRKKGQRSVFQMQRAMIADGATVRECIDLAGANFQSIRSAEVLMEYVETRRPIGAVEVFDDMTLSEVYEVESDVYMPPVGPLHSWTGYDAHPAVVIDCVLHSVDLVTLQRLIAPWPFKVNTKRGCRQALYTRIYVLRPPVGYHPPSRVSDCRI